MNHHESILTIDLGTSGPKVSVFDENLKLQFSTFREVKLIFIGKDGVEQNPLEWTQAIHDCMKELGAHNQELLKSIKAINVTAQWSGTVAVDHQGNTIGNAMSWMDSRGAPHAHQLTDGFIKIDGYAISKIMKWISTTGGLPTKSGKDSISHILYLKNERQKDYEKTEVFLEPKDYINFFLSGRKCATHDSITVHWITDNRDIHHIQYSESLIKKCGIDRNKLPELIPTNSILGKILPELAAQWGLSDETIIVGGTPDIHSAAIGSGGVKDFIPHLYIGTSSLLFPL